MIERAFKKKTDIGSVNNHDLMQSSKPFLRNFITREGSKIQFCNSIRLLIF